MSMRVGIVGASGYVGGELVRLLLDHPDCEIVQVTSERRAGMFLHSVHPHLRGRCNLKFSSSAELVDCDLLILALPHGRAALDIERFAAHAERIIDCSADFRLSDAAAYARWYGSEHPAPDWLDRFVYGLPEIHRERLREARYVSGVGCNATAATLALRPLVQSGVIDADHPVFVDLKVGSSEGGRAHSEASHHPERSGVMRSFAPVGHRHTAEVMQNTGLQRVHLSVTSVEVVRGVLATCQVILDEALSERDLWGLFREAWTGEPFVRIVHEKRGLYRHPEPRILTGSNYADVGFAPEEDTDRLVVLCAIDNLVKGAAGSAVQCLNLMCGFEETAGLGFAGLHPV